MAHLQDRMRAVGQRQERRHLSIRANVSSRNFLSPVYATKAFRGNYIDRIEHPIYPEGKPCKTDADCTNNASDKCNVADGLCLHA